MVLKLRSMTESMIEVKGTREKTRLGRGGVENTEGKRHICENNVKQQANNNENRYIIIYASSDGDSC